jgi:hypothetical protein
LGDWAISNKTLFQRVKRWDGREGRCSSIRFLSANRPLLFHLQWLFQLHVHVDMCVRLRLSSQPQACTPHDCTRAAASHTHARCIVRAGCVSSVNRNLGHQKHRKTSKLFSMGNCLFTYRFKVEPRLLGSALFFLSISGLRI